MKRPRLGLAALALAAAVVFAPRPWVPDAPSGAHDPSGHLIGRILSPTFSTGDVRERDFDRSIKQAGSFAVGAAAISLALIVHRRRRALITPARHYCSRDVVFRHPSRAPPSLLLT